MFIVVCMLQVVKHGTFRNKVRLATPYVSQVRHD